jgi:nucleoside-diphosphate-sugar epimerase
VAKAALAAGVRRFVYVSTAKVFGEETTDRAFHEGDAPAPMDAYARSKLMAETEVIRLALETGTEVVIVRPPLVYGPNARGNLVRIVKAVQRGLPLPVASRDNRRSLVSVWNLCEVLERAAVQSGLSGRILLPTDDRPVSTRQLVQLLAKAMGCRARFLELPDPILALLGGVPGIRSQLQKLNGSLELDGVSTWRLLGAEPPVAVEAGILRMLTEDGVIR